MKEGIFISYRRNDSRGETGRIYDRLLNHVKSKNIFFDVDNISPGENFEEEVVKAIDQCNTMLVIIGKNWITEIQSKTQINKSINKDWVELEIVTAIEKKLRIIPVLLEDTKMLADTQLPESMHPLLLKNAISIRHLSFHADFTVLLKELNSKRKTEGVEKKEQSSFTLLFSIFLFFCLFLCLIYYFDRQQKNKDKEHNRIEKLVEMIHRDYIDLSDSNSDYARVGGFSNFYFIPSPRLLRDTITYSNRDIWYYNPLEKKYFFEQNNLQIFKNYKKDSLVAALQDSKYFFVSRFNVDNLLWEAIMGEEPPKRTSPCNGCPLSQIAWEKIQTFLEKLNLKTGNKYRVLKDAEKKYIDYIMAIYSGPDSKYFKWDAETPLLKKYGGFLNPKKEKIIDLGFRLCSNTKITDTYYNVKTIRTYDPTTKEDGSN